MTNAQVALSHSGSDVREQITSLSAGLRAAHEQGRLDDDLYEAARTEVGTADAAAKDGPTGRGRLVIALKRLSGLVSGFTDLSTAVAAVIALAENRP
ncbi:hypothetical protein [Cryptosporangium arvum]|uniref:Uncharacterized protein n=1 Tax=Cryptosporangium arvum DSM 44712 TaxID=927661 RepID=A0A010ZW87_9ACTN|nr:hypothetical protein [Cryptosporangium arvum]EXG82929.1 hypothetical protein CryarDRAFT_4133 [Cryptosporangium arvum DSM 44712]